MSKTVRWFAAFLVFAATWAWADYALARDTATWDDEEEIVTLTDRKSDWCDDKKKTDAPRDFVEVEWRAAKRYDKSTKVTTAACWTFSP